MLLTTSESYLPTGVPFKRALWVFLVVVACAALALRARRLSPSAVLAAMAVAAMLVHADGLIGSPAFADLRLVVAAGERFLADGPVYPQVVEPPGASLPFVYAPPSLPLFAAIGGLGLLGSVLYTAGLVGALVAGNRLLGMPWRWAFLFLLWPPAWMAIWVGNIAGYLWFLFAAAPWYGSLLVLVGGAKLYSMVGALWLFRADRLTSLVRGFAALALIAVVTLPIVGIERWAEWLTGLGVYQQMGALYAGPYVGYTLRLVLPSMLLVATWLGTVVFAFAAPVRESLERFGLATVVISTTTHAHGFLPALPAFTRLRLPWLWLAILVTSTPAWYSWWLAIALAVVGALVPALRREAGPADPDQRWLDPLDGRVPWPLAPFEQAPVTVAEHSAS